MSDCPLGIEPLWKAGLDKGKFRGRPRVFKSPQKLWEGCVKYFEWYQSNPLYEKKLTTFQGESQLESVPKLRAMTLGSLYVFLGISERCWDDYRKREEFSGIVSRVEHMIRTQKIEGAAADLLNANIIAREVGLRDSKEVTGADGSPLVPGREANADQQAAANRESLLALLDEAVE